MGGLTWPDLVIGGVALFFALKGWKRGFVREIGGLFALVAAIWAAFRYPGILDGLATDTLHVNPGSAHIVGMIMFAAIVYVAVLVVAGLLGRIAKLPLINLGNSAAGAALGIVKALLGVWIVLYIALFFPLNRDLRKDLHASQLVSLVAAEIPQVDGMLENTVPAFLRPMVEPIFAHHRI